ncbi:MAG: GNAT family N-acetyltransferase [Gemmatimonadaceae bacterium]
MNAMTLDAVRPRAATITVREARASDNAALVALAAACPMTGEITMCVDRAPDFFALARLEGERWKVGVAEQDDVVIGCVAASERWAYVDGHPTRTGYAGDLKVHPAYRGGPAADKLQEMVRATGREFGGDDMLSLVTVLGGNRSMERRTAGPRGLPTLEHLATLHVHAIPFLWPRARAVAGIAVRRARDEDLDEMAALWSRLAPERQLAPVMDAERFRAWLASAPGLFIDDYLVARRADGRIVAFVGVWDQRELKTLRVLRYSGRLAAVRRAVNAVAPLLGTARLPATGGALPSLAAVHLCAPDDPSVLRSLLLHAYSVHRASGALCLTLALDTRDPRTRALRGLLAQPTAVNAYVTTPAGRWTGARLDGRPLHFESALV